MMGVVFLAGKPVWRQPSFVWHDKTFVCAMPISPTGRLWVSVANGESVDPSFMRKISQRPQNSLDSGLFKDNTIG